MKILVTIEGMSCGGCVRSVERALQRVDGITRSDVQVGKAEIELASEDESAVARVRSAIEDAGFDVADASRA